MVSKSFWENKRVLITGYRGFVGSWLYSVFNECGTAWYGIDKLPALLPGDMTVSMDMANNHLDIVRYVEHVRPDVIFHFAADPIVKNGYVDPQSMLQNNIMSTVNLYSALHEFEYKGLVVNMTTDKVYAPSSRTAKKGHTEADIIGASDPYGCSKVCADNIGRMFHSLGIRGITVRAGNIYGGGDYGENRLFPHIVKNIESPTIKLRNPKGTRPYQYVLNFLDNLLIVTRGEIDGRYAHLKDNDIWNIGPKEEKSNEQIAREFLYAWTAIGSIPRIPEIVQDHTVEFAERDKLRLCCDKLYQRYPHNVVLNDEIAVLQTAHVYRAIEAQKATGKYDHSAIARKMNFYAKYIITR